MTVAIPVRNGGELFAGVLRALAAPDRRARAARVRLGLDRRLAAARARARRARDRDRARALQPRRHAQPADGAGARARTWRCSPRTPSRPTSAGWSGCSGGFELARRRGDRLRALPPAAGRRARRCASSSSAGSPRSRPTARPRVERLARATSASLPAVELIGRRGLLHRRQRVRLARGRLGAGAVPRGPLCRGPGARDRHAARRLRQGVRARRGGAPLPRLHAARAAAPLLRRVARAARGLRLARARLARAICSASCGASSARRDAS